MTVTELLDILKEYPGETEVELAIIAPVTDDEDIAVDRYLVEGVLPWDDEEGSSVWLVGGEEADVEAFLDAVEDDEDDDEEA